MLSASQCDQPRAGEDCSLRHELRTGNYKQRAVNALPASTAPQIVRKGFDVGNSVEVLVDKSVQVLDISPWDVDHVIGFDHDVASQISHIKNSLQIQSTTDRLAVNVFGYQDDTCEVRGERIVATCHSDRVQSCDGLSIRYGSLRANFAENIELAGLGCSERDRGYYMLQRPCPVQPIDGVLHLTDGVARAHNPFVDKRQVDGPIRLYRDCGLAATREGGERVSELLDLFVKGIHMNCNQPVILQLSTCFVLTEYASFQEFLFDLSSKLVRGQTYGLDLSDGLERDHAIGPDSHCFVELGIKNELDGDLIERVQFVGADGDIPFSLKENSELVVRPKPKVTTHDVKGFGKVLGLWGLLRPGRGPERRGYQADASSQNEADKAGCDQLPKSRVYPT